MTCTSAADLAEQKALAAAKMAAQEAATAAASASTAAAAAANAQTANKAHDEASYALAKNAADRAKTASDAAAAANTAAQAATTSAAAEAQQAIAERHQQTAEAERANAMKYAGMVLAAKTKADSDAAAAKAKAAANKVALSKKKAIMAEASASEGARPFDGTNADANADPTGEQNYRLTVEHTGSTVKATVVDGKLPADNDPMFARTATFGGGQMLVRNIGTERQIIVLHTDIEAPTQEAFSSVYNLTVDRDTDTTANDTYVVQTGDNGKIASSNFPSGVSTTRNYVQYADTTAGRAGQFSGTFDGASGVYRCVASGGCSVSTDTKGKFNTLTESQWEFTPAAGATVAVADKDYLTWGFWLDTTTKDGSIASYDTVQTFAMSKLPVATSVDSVTGTASYAGDAAGVYVHETKNEDGTLDAATSGRFTADVAMKAYFEATTLRQANTIEGTISNFDLDGGPVNSWNVNVSASFGDSGALASGVASGMEGNNGSLSGQFHSAANRESTAAPGILIGEFNANFVNGTVAGAYGARKQ